MKFTREDAYKELVAKLTEKGEKLNLSERTLKQQLETLIKFVANDEMELVEFVKEVLPSMKELDGQYRKDNSDFIKEWEKNHPATEPKPNANPKPNGNENPEMAKLLERLEALEAENKANKAASAIREKKAELKEVLRENGVDDDEWIDLMMQKVSIPETFDVKSEADFYIKLYNKSNPVPKDPVTPYSPTSGTSRVDDSIALAASNKKRKREEEKIY